MVMWPTENKTVHLHYTLVIGFKSMLEGEGKVRTPNRRQWGTQPDGVIRHAEVEYEVHWIVSRLLTESSRIGMGFEGSGKAEGRIDRGCDKFLENRMASNREGQGRVRLGNSYYFLLSISPGGQFSPATLRSSRIRGAKMSRGKGFVERQKRVGKPGAGLLQEWVFIKKNKFFEKKIQNLISLTKAVILVGSLPPFIYTKEKQAYLYLSILNCPVTVALFNSHCLIFPTTRGLT